MNRWREIFDLYSKNNVYIFTYQTGGVSYENFESNYYIYIFLKLLQFI